MTQAILSQTCIILFLMAVGLLAARLGCLTDQVQGAMSNFLMTYSLPASLLLSAEGPLTADMRQDVLWMLGLAMAFYLAAVPLSWLLSRRVSGPRSRKNLFAASLAFANTAFLGFPVADALFPENGLFCAAFFSMVFNLVVFTAGMKFFSPDGRMGSPRVLLTNPNILAILAMMALLALDWHLPPLIHEPVERLGSLCAPLSLVLVGARLADFSPRQLLEGRALKAMALLRLVITPVICTLLLWPLPAPYHVKMVTVVMCAMPTAANTVILAQQKGVPADFAARAVALTSFLFPAALPPVLLFAQAVLG